MTPDVWAGSVKANQLVAASGAHRGGVEAITGSGSGSDATAGSSSGLGAPAGSGLTSGSGSGASSAGSQLPDGRGGSGFGSVRPACSEATAVIQRAGREEGSRSGAEGPRSGSGGPGSGSEASRSFAGDSTCSGSSSGSHDSRTGAPVSSV